jgi:outer membrane protein
MPCVSTRCARRMCLVVLLIGGATSSLAQTAPQSPPAGAPSAEAAGPRKVTLAEAIDYALKNQPAVKAALARVAARQAEVAIPRGQWLPSVGLTAQLLVGTANNTTASYLGAALVPIPRVGGTVSVTGSTASWSPEPSSFAGLGVTQQIFEFGRIAAEISAAESQVTVERRSADAQSLDVRFGVEEAYFAVYSAKAVVRAAAEGLERARAHYEMARAGVAQGLRPPIEQTRVAAEVARLDLVKVRAEGNVRVSQTLLAAAVGSPEAALDIADQAPTPAELPPLEATVQRALGREPQLQAALERIHVQEEETRAAFAQLRPEFLFAGTLNARAGGSTPSGSAPVPSGDGWIPEVPNWQVGIIFSWPIFEGTLWARAEASREREVVRREEAALIKQDLVARIDTTYVAVTIAREALPRLAAAVEAARANYAQADARFKAGLGTSVELADAQTLRTDTEIQLALGQFDLARTRAAFGRAIAEGL